MSYPRVKDIYGGGDTYNKKIRQYESGLRLSEKFGDTSIPNAGYDETMAYEQSGLNYNTHGYTNPHFMYEDDEDDGEPYEMSKAGMQGTTYIDSDDDDDIEELYDDEDEIGSLDGVEKEMYTTQTKNELYSPMIATYHKASDYVTQSEAMKKMMKNKNNVFDISSHLEYKLVDGMSTVWSFAREWGDDGKSNPYEYSGSPFDSNRLIKRIWLKSASHNSITSQTLTFSLLNPLTRQEMLKPIIPVLVKTHEEGPTHLVLRPNEKLSNPLLLWCKDTETRRSPVIEQYPNTTAEELKLELQQNSNPREKNYVKNLVDGSSILLEFIKDKIKHEGYQDNLTRVASEGYYKIPIKSAMEFIKLWQIEQSRDLALSHLKHLTVRPNRAVRSERESENFNEDIFQDKAEIRSQIDVWNIGAATEEKQFISKAIKHKPINLYWTLRIELVPKK